MPLVRSICELIFITTFSLCIEIFAERSRDRYPQFIIFSIIEVSWVGTVGSDGLLFTLPFDWLFE